MSEAESTVFSDLLSPSAEEANAAAPKSAAVSDTNGTRIDDCVIAWSGIIDTE